MNFELMLNVENGVIKTNAKEMLAALDPALKKYDYVVMPDVYDQAKEDRAALNKLVKTISDERKRTEKNVFGTWEQDKKAIMDAEKKIKQYADNLGNGIAQIDDEEKEKKDMELEQLWYKKSNRPYDLVRKKEWLNKSWSMKKIGEDMDRLVEGIKMKEITVESFLPNDPVERQQVLDVFNTTLDPIQAKQEADKIADANKRVQSLYEAPADLSGQNMQQAQANTRQMSVYASEITYNAEFRCSGTKEQMNALADFIYRNGIRCEVIKKWQS
ncbi:MAG: DUF1351 domain-containing protein [Candidatus Bathyarchaeota archaeon]|nr:DUF1351 domain-containing protein [Candidatus Bathyarchaeota archaeon]